jgi:hypothetical protein
LRRVAFLVCVACSSRAAPPPPVETVETVDTVDVVVDGDVDVDERPPGPSTSPVAPTHDGVDFTAEAKLLFRIAACGNDDPLPDGYDPRIVAAHCKIIRAAEAAYRTKYVEGGRAFFDEVVPDDVPPTVVYPFGGGDLISALVAFPFATEITTISLELAGDPRRIARLDAGALKRSLAALRVQIGGTLLNGSNTSENLSASQRNDLPVQVSSFLMGLAANGFEPVGMRYFTLDDDGAVHYLDADEIAALDARAKSRKGDWRSPNFAEAFANVEIRYRAQGDAAAPIRVHRHLGWNLADYELVKHPQLLRHLEAKGKVTVLTKGASYLLWMPSFAQIRTYLLTHLAWMLSDSTGIPPRFAKQAGMEQITYGRFDNAFLPTSRGTRDARDFRALWRSQPSRKMPFRFGYLDAGLHPHLVVTRPGGTGPR